MATLGNTNQTLDAVVQSSPVAILGLDASRRVIVWNRNAERIFGLSATDVVGRPFPPLIEVAGSQLGDMVRRLLEGEVLTDVEIHQQPSKTATLELRVSGAPLYDGDQRVRGAVCIVEDVTESRATRRQLEHAQRMEAVGQLTGGLAHDFNNLLAVVIGNLDLLHDQPELQATSKESVDLALKASLGGATLIKPAPRLLAPTGPVAEGVRPRRAGHLHARAARPHSGRAYRGRDAAGVRSLAGDGRCGPGRIRDRQPGDQRARRDAERREPDPGNRQQASRPALYGRQSRCTSGRLCDVGGLRHRYRHPARGAGPGVRAVLHHQGTRQGQRTWASAWSMASPSSRAATSRSTARSGMAPPSASTCRAPWRRSRQPNAERAGSGRQRKDRRRNPGGRGQSRRAPHRLPAAARLRLHRDRGQ